MFTNIETAKAFARHLKFKVRQADPSIKLSTCQAITARMCLYNDWHHLEQAILNKPHEPPADVIQDRLQQELKRLGLSLKADDILGTENLSHEGKLIFHATSDFIRDLIENSGDEGERRMLQSLLKSRQPEVLEYRHDNGVYLLKLVPFDDHFPVIWIYPFSGSQRLSEVSNPPKLIKLALEYQTSWFEATFNEFLLLSGWDTIKPNYEDEEVAALMIESSNKLTKSTNRRTSHSIAVQAVLKTLFKTTLDALSTDQARLLSDDIRQSRKLAHLVLSNGDDINWYSETISKNAVIDELAKTDIMEGFDLAAKLVLSLDPGQVVCRDNHYMAPFHFLPSEYGIGCRPSLYGWPGSEEWKLKYADLKGVALRPEYDPDDFAVNLAQKHFEDCGVQFLSVVEAQAYLDREAQKLGSLGRSVNYWRLPPSLRRPKAPSLARRISATFKDLMSA